MTIEQVVKTFKAKRPTDVETVLQNCRVSLRWISSGLFRDVYQVNDLPLVVKIPSCWHGLKSTRVRRTHIAEAIEHSRQEVAAIRRIRRSVRKYKPLKHLLPTIYHFNHRSGMMLMEKYDKVQQAYRKRCAAASKLVQNCTGRCGDLHSKNYGLDQHGNLIILDTGYLFAGESSS